jgi:cytochrome P450
LHQGQYLHAFIAATNRDLKKFDEPDTFDITRHPNPHVSFGFGIYYCIGAPMARLELQVALESLLERYPHMQLAGQNLKH